MIWIQCHCGAKFALYGWNTDLEFRAARSKFERQHGSHSVNSAQPHGPASWEIE
jgi:hypothetical protein